MLRLSPLLEHYILSVLFVNKFLTKKSSQHPIGEEAEYCPAAIGENMAIPFISSEALQFCLYII